MGPVSQKLLFWTYVNSIHRLNREVQQKGSPYRRKSDLRRRHLIWARPLVHSITKKVPMLTTVDRRKIYS